LDGSHPPFFYFLLGGHLGWKSGLPDTILEGAIQGSFHKCLVAIGPVVSEEKIRGMKLKKKIFSSETTEPISTKLC
jgi:hypothetical protein